MKTVITDFNKQRDLTQFQKIQLMIAENPQLAESMKFQGFCQRHVNKKGALGVDNDDPYIYKVNSQILLMEEIFESRRNRMMVRPQMKEQVVGNLQNCLATPQFLLALKKQQYQIDKQM